MYISCYLSLLFSHITFTIAANCAIVLISLFLRVLRMKKIYLEIESNSVN